MLLTLSDPRGGVLTLTNPRMAAKKRGLSPGGSVQGGVWLVTQGQA